MIRSARLALVLGFALALSGCFVSDKPLISEADSQTPIAPGRYVNSAMDPDTYALVTVNGNVTVLASSDDKGETEEMALLMRKLRDDYFIVMDRSDSSYTLVRVHDRLVDEFRSDQYCKKLHAVAKKRGVDVASFGVVNEQKDDTSICSFDDYDKLAGAFAALLDEKMLEVGETYKHVD